MGKSMSKLCGRGGGGDDVLKPSSPQMARRGQQDGLSPRAAKYAKNPRQLEHAVVEDQTNVRETDHAEIHEDAKGHKVVNQYTLTKKLGEGAYGKVKLAYETDNKKKQYAVKIMNKSILKKKKNGSTVALDDVMREIAIMKKLKHANVATLYEVIDDPEKEKMYLVMELIEGGVTMDQQKPKPLKEKRVQDLMRDALLGLEYLHFQRVIHRDIKPENLLVTKSGWLKYTDFGVSQTYDPDDDDSMRKTAGSPAFMAPETCTGEVFHGKDVDIWALGITCFMWLTGEVPFKQMPGDGPMALYDRIQEDPVVFPSKPKISASCRDFLECMLEKDPDRRATLAELKEHDFVTSNGAHPLPELQVKKIEVSRAEIDTALTPFQKFHMVGMIAAKMHRQASIVRARHSPRSSVSSMSSADSPR
eukprot:GFYU01017194.1.p1 GENE.GFYU01017194.1~~GFYU01017194.1.p1  ORF type:complete len:418 (+),score=53.16 GFYU01017194.1:249-1502(+)